MRPMKFKKISDKNNLLGFNEIILINKFITRNEEIHIDYSWDAICDNFFRIIEDTDLGFSADAYEFVEFI